MHPHLYRIARTSGRLHSPPDSNTGGGADTAGGAGGSSAGADSSKGGDDDFVDPFLAEYQSPGGDDGDGDDDGEPDAETLELLNQLAPKEKEADKLDPKGKPDDSLTRNKAAGEALGAELKQLIDNMTLPDNIFGDDFNPNDPAALKAAMVATTRHTLQQALALTMKPMRLAMQQMNEYMVRQMKDEIAAAQGEFKTVSRLESLVPAFGNPQSRAVLTPMRDLLVKQGKSVEEQAKVLNGIATRLGLSREPAKGRREQGAGSRDQGSGVKKGANALDAIFGNM